MLLKVRPSSAISSLPRTGIRPDRSVSEIVRAVRESAFSGAIARPAASQMNSDAKSRTTIETPIAIRTALSTWSRSAAVSEAASSTPPRSPTETGIATNGPRRTRCRPRRWSGRSTSAKPANASARPSWPGSETLTSRSSPSVKVTRAPSEGAAEPLM